MYCHVDNKLLMLILDMTIYDAIGSVKVDILSLRCLSYLGNVIENSLIDQDQ